ncbi:MAG: hypothetical protein AAF577_15715 [Pseudomonadota bacterium]
MTRLASLITLAMLALGLAGCAAGPTPYLAANPAVGTGAGTGGGYTDAALEDDRYRITYSASPATPVALIEDYLLYRAAEVTLANGGTWFRLVDSETVPVVNFYTTTVAAPVFTSRIFVVKRFGKSRLPHLPRLSEADQAKLSGKRDSNNDGFKGPRRKFKPAKIRGHRKFRRKSRRFHRRKSGVAVGFGFGFPLYLGPYGYGYGSGPFYGYGPGTAFYGIPRGSVSRIEASAEILIDAGPLPEDADDTTAYDAQAVIDAIGPRLPRPES